MNRHPNLTEELPSLPTAFPTNYEVFIFQLWVCDTVVGTMQTVNSLLPASSNREIEMENLKEEKRVVPSLFTHPIRATLVFMSTAF